MSSLDVVNTFLHDRSIRILSFPSLYVQTDLPLKPVFNSLGAPYLRAEEQKQTQTVWS